MNRKLAWMFAALSVVFTLNSISSHAQSAPKFEAKIPFEFKAGTTSLPAGEYLIGLVGTQTEMLAIQNVKTGERAVVIPVGVETNVMQNEAKLTFHRYGDQYFLSQLLTPGTTHGMAIPRTRAELELAKSSGQTETAVITGQLR